ncbi:uncharacterized protein J8A68_005477 [[Candida] subhashii]|uniref:Uncharacterized protein n=1 Tax=[Candida] subhashii TaxID=561895 RepID=A0A8J5QCJ2_9ASCO|nr:uncharacterized protein J8A68_005477 [[Candida] subhashii]KAG7660957.1 hypothetical protein J8A68_005477 [[Candida] subhashii]
MSSNSNLRKSMQVQVDNQRAAEALRIATQNAQHQQQQQQLHHRQQQEEHHQKLLMHQQQQLHHQQQSQLHHQQHQQHQQRQQQQQQQQQYHMQQAAVAHQQQQQQQSPQATEFSGLTEFDLKSRDSKYRRWTPKMDQFLIKLLSDVVHSYPKGAEATMTKKAWAYVTGQLRGANPETVYSTYTKYSCQQHLLNVNHHRYKIWFVLMLHQKNNPSNTGYSYRWNPDLGRFQIIDNTTGSLILDERQVKSLLYSESLSLPPLSAFNKGNLIVNDFFLSDNLKYMSVYHNEVLPLLIRLDPKYAEGLGDIYGEIPKFDYQEASHEYFKPLIPLKTKSSTSVNSTPKSKKRRHSTADSTTSSGTSVSGTVTANTTVGVVATSSGNSGLPHSHAHSHSHSHNHVPDADDVTSLPFSKSLLHDGPDPTDVTMHHLTRAHHQQHQNHIPNAMDESVDPALKRSRITDTTTIDFENALASAAIAAINSPPVTNGRDPTPYYIKDRKWFNKLINLHDSGLIGVDEVLSVCEGVRDNKIPLFMLNVLDHSYYPTRNNAGSMTEDIPDEEMAKRIREFMLPMVYNS